MVDRASGVAVLWVLLVATAGCLGVLTGENAASFEASVAGVDDAVLDETGYEETRVEPQVISRSVSAAGQTREVEVTNHVAEYARMVEIAGATGEFARFTVVSTPKIELLGRTFNPVGDRTNRELAREVQGQDGSVSDLAVAGERSVAMLDAETTVTRFTGTTTAAGGVEIDVTIHLAKVEHGDDYVIAVAVHPSALAGERDHVDRLLRGITHPA